MDDARIRKQVEALIVLCRTGQGESDEEQIARVMQGTMGIVELLYGRGSVQLETFRESSSFHRANVHIASYREVMSKVSLGVLRNILAELDAGLIGSIRRQAAAEVLTDFVVLSRSALDEGGSGQKRCCSPSGGGL